jgi:peptide/nickel transport system substrate-binding protein
VLGSALVAGSGLAAAAFAGCGDDDDDDDDEGGGSQGLRPDQVDTNATLRAGIKADAGNLDPQSIAGRAGIPNYEVHFITPLAKDPKSNLAIGYAMDYAWVENNTKLQLKVKPGIKFHNGEALNAEQVKFNFDRILGKSDVSPNFGNPGAGFFGAITEAVVVDDLTLNLHFQTPNVTIPDYLAAASGIFLVPKGAVKEIGDQAFAQKPSGSGPFKFVSRTADTEIRSTRFDEFFNPRDNPLGPRLPWVKDLVQRVIPEDGARVAALQAGEIDVCNDLNADLAKSIEGQAGYKVFYQLDRTPNQIMFNMLVDRDPITGGPNPFKDIRVRKALNHAIDVDAISKRVLTGRELRFPEALEQKRYKFDPAQAKALLTQAGFPNGFETDLHGGTGRFVAMEPVIEAVVGYLRDVGVKVNVKLTPYAAYAATLVKKEFTGMIYAGSATPELALFPLYHSKGTQGYSIDPALGLDALIDQTLKEFDVQKRAQLYGDIITKFYDNANWIFLHQHARPIATRANIDWQPYVPTGFLAEYWNMKVAKA